MKTQDILLHFHLNQTVLDKFLRKELFLDYLTFYFLYFALFKKNYVMRFEIFTSFDILYTNLCTFSLHLYFDQNQNTIK